MLIKNRPDGKRALVPGFLKMIPILMPTRNESSIYMDHIYSVDNTMEFIAEWNKKLPEGRLPLSVMQILLAAFSRIVFQRPAINRFVSNYRHYQRNNVSVSFITKKNLTDEGEETNVIMAFRPEDTLDDVNARFSRRVMEAKSEEGNKTESDVELFEKLPVGVLRAYAGFLKFLDRHNWIPRFMVQQIPFFCTAFLANVGSLKLDAPFHHNYEVGNCGIFITLGKMTFEKYIDRNNEIRERKIVHMRYTVDDRIVDGIYSGRAMKLLKDYVENPQKLTVPVKLNEDQLTELSLTEKGWRLWETE